MEPWGIPNHLSWFFVFCWLNSSESDLIQEG